MASFNDLLKTAETYNFAKDYPLVAQIPSDPNRCYKLEGYLFPSTYEFYKNDKPEDAIRAGMAAGQQGKIYGGYPE